MTTAVMATARPMNDFMAAAATVGAVAIGAVLVEAALIPGIALGAAMVLGPRLVKRPFARLTRQVKAALADNGAAETSLPAVEAKFGVKQALAKTITFRITVTSLDLAFNYIVIGELATAAGLSAISLFVGPVFYFAHEAAWNYYRQDAARLGMDRALAKTIVYQAFGTTMDFTVNFLVVGDLTTAAILTAPRFVLGPFVYLGHEKAWDYFERRSG